MAKVLRITNEIISPEEALQQFLLLKKAQGLAERTLKDYKYHVSLFFKHCDGWEGVSKRLYEHMSQEIKASTFNIRLRYLRTFFEWCVSEGYLSKNPLQGWKLRKEEPKIVNIPDEVLKQLLDAPDKKTFVGLRDYTFILLQLDTGIRPKEAMSLTKDDVCFKQMLVSVKASSAKTRVARTLPISAITGQALKKLIASHHEAWKTNLIFCTHDGKAMDSTSWGRRMSKYSKDIGYKIRPYDLRHSFALGFLRANGNIFSLQQIMGHTNLTMTQQYLSLTDEDIKNQHAQSSPLNSITKPSRVRKL